MDPDASGSWSQQPIVLKSYTSHTPPYYQYGMALSDTTSFPDDLVAMFSIGGTAVSADFTNSGWAYGKWNFVAITYDGSYIRGYVNGHLVGTQAQTGTLDSYSTPVDIGAYANLAKNSAHLFKGGIADVAIYSTALGEDTLQSDYSYGFAAATPNTASTPYTRTLPSRFGRPPIQLVLTCVISRATATT